MRKWPLNNCTEFQKKVYKAISKISKGKVRTYKWVAQRIGKPNAYRAVGQALKRNPYPDIIPCHRVIKSDGTLGGFSQGVNRKKKLLEKEGVKYLTFYKKINIIKSPCWQ